MAGARWKKLRAELDLPEVPDELLQLAFQHGSYVREQGIDGILSNQRLEFLGDAVLDLIVAEELFHKNPDLHEGVLTKTKASLVRAGSLAKAAARANLGDYLLLGRGEEESGGRQKSSLLADVFEALIGAIYVAKGLEATRRFVLQHLPVERLSDQEAHDRFDHKTALQELVQSHARQLPLYETIHSEGPAHNLTFTVEVRFNGTTIGLGKGASKRKAEQEAARQALEQQEKWLPQLLKQLRKHENHDHSGK